MILCKVSGIDSVVGTLHSLLLLSNGTVKDAIMVLL